MSLLSLFGAAFFFDRHTPTTHPHVAHLVRSFLVCDMVACLNPKSTGLLLDGHLVSRSGGFENMDSEQL